jgi:carboxylesterase type B
MLVSKLILLLQGASLTIAVGPEVVLDYTTLIPAAGNSSTGFYKYQNIRYAAPPTGALRWAPPQWPAVEKEINAGNLAAIDVSCASVEDCLFMDVWVPTSPTKRGPLPVMVWQHGGAFTVGSKVQQAADQTTPEGLFSLTSDFIFVSFNYRLGLAGLATGSTFNHGGGTSNAGLWDTEHGLKWLQRYIHAFGGDPDQVTAVGHSAGGSCWLFQMTRFSGRAEQLFARGYIQSSGYWPGAGHWSAEQFWLNVSAAAGCAGGSVDCMRSLPFSAINAAASRTVGATGYVFQPKVDGNFVADTYEAQFYQRNFNFTGPFVITHQLHEENSLPAAGISSTEDIIKKLNTVFPAMPQQAIDQVRI